MAEALIVWMLTSSFAFVSQGNKKNEANSFGKPKLKKHGKSHEPVSPQFDSLP